MRRLLLAALAAVVFAAPAAAQLGDLVSPGPLSAAHSKLEGLKSCEKCHEQGKQISAARCLDCHKDVASRIAQKKGVHRDVKDKCAACHAEHAGRDAELRPFETKGFDHAKEAGFPLDGKHAPLEQKCASCHKTRSFLKLSPSCVTCHADSHKGALGAACITCHSTAVAFKETRQSFDHGKTKYPLTGAHVKVACAKCHANAVFRGVKFATCADCHKDPHQGRLGADCSSCHETATFRTVKVDHAKTTFPLRGRHAELQCTACHKEPATKVKLKAGSCATCHQDPHRGEFKQDCSTCHNEKSFKGAPFDHAVKTKFALTGKHATARCAACHVPPGGAGPANANGGLPKVVVFKGLKTDCAVCHKDPHKGLLGTACATCHGTESFRPKDYRHPRFPEFFAGLHEKVGCEKCHGGPKTGPNGKPVPVGERTYRGLSVACATCHKDPHLGQFTASCESCHAVTGAKFAPVNFDHAKSAFPLAGRHAPLACEKCHRKETATFPSGSGTAVRLKGLGTACATCHKDPHLGQLGASCATCHTAETFKVPAFKHKGSPEFWKGAHATAPCAKCHKSEEAAFPSGKGTAVRYKGFGASCASCHKDAHSGTLGPRCESCHTPSGAWKSASRAFHKTSWPLEGKHLLVPCASCHVKGQTKGTPRACADCHWYRRQDDRFKTRLGLDCQNCHRPVSWTAVTWNHAAATGFALSGTHAGVACEKCHTDGVFRKGQSGCVGCHREDYDRTRNPNHAAAGFPTTCETCHKASDTSWDQVRFDHRATFPLSGKHATAACASCHKNGVYHGTARDCAGCHLPLYQRATNPSHIQAGFPTTCESCHKSSDPAWTGIAFNHSKWPLSGRHSSQTCTSCHRSGVFQGLPSTCVSCHQANYQRTTNPNHVTAGFPTTCETCHKVADTTWQQGKFDHATVFPLVGRHSAAACVGCHASGVYRGTARDCAGCHLSLYQRSTNPSHIQAGFPTTCETCHKATDTAWTGVPYNHSKWPLVGRHTAQACTTCHRSGVFQGLPNDCASCHLSKYQATTNPNHATAGFSTACQTCHKVSDLSWNQGTFNHATVFPLVGVHTAQACASCHRNGVYKGTPRDCAGCHLAKYQSAKDPNHVTAGFPTTCETCHKATDTSWDKGTFNHGASFPLVGVHATQACASCHRGGVYQGTSRTCVGCHLPKYQATTNPNHATAGFSTTCETCHKGTDTSWNQGTFNHATAFALVGRHAAAACASCHVGGVYRGTPRTCVGCHLPKYQSTTNPNHAAAGFPTTCETCHRATDTSWGQGTFNHAASFALVGVHATQACASCHRNGVYQGTPRTCVGCHLPKYQSTTNPNHAAAGFPTTCETCHRATDTSWGQGTFNHATAFALVGRHATAPCASCHVGGVYRGTPRVCSGCHMAKYQATTNPNHAAAGFPTTCETCHRATDTSWGQGTFNHTWFPISSGRHSGNPCSACHTSSSNYAVFTCITCHTRSTTDGHHRGVSGYRYDSAACYACHPQGRAG